VCFINYPVLVVAFFSVAPEVLLGVRVETKSLFQLLLGLNEFLFSVLATLDGCCVGKLRIFELVLELTEEHFAGSLLMRSFRLAVGILEQGLSSFQVTFQLLNRIVIDGVGCLLSHCQKLAP